MAVIREWEQLCRTAQLHPAVLGGIEGLPLNDSLDRRVAGRRPGGWWKFDALNLRR